MTDHVYRLMKGMEVLRPLFHMIGFAIRLLQWISIKKKTFGVEKEKAE